MGIAGKAVGPGGLALLAVTAVAGIVLAVHGWSARHAGLAPGSLAGTSTRPSAGATSTPPARTPTARASSSAAPAATPGASATTPAGHAGPPLRSQSYAPYSYLVWPGTPSSAAHAALTGLSVSVHRQGSGISVTAGVNGQPAGAAHFYPLGARVYVVEATVGDDSGNSDYNLGDDGVVVTDAHGRIVQ